MGSKTAYRRTQTMSFGNLSTCFKLLLWPKWCLLETHLYWGWNKETLSQGTNAKVYNGNFPHRLSRSSSVHNQQQEKWCVEFFGSQQGPMLERYIVRGSGVKVLMTARFCGTNWRQQLATNGSEYSWQGGVAWQCLTTLSGRDCRNSSAVEDRGLWASSVQPRPHCFGLPPIWSTRRRFKMPSIHYRPNTRGSGACLACRSADSLFCWGHTEDCPTLD
jgi:hypothetical protein